MTRKMPSIDISGDIASLAWKNNWYLSCINLHDLTIRLEIITARTASPMILRRTSVKIETVRRERSRLFSSRDRFATSVNYPMKNHLAK